jgi:hypothetical protein
MKDIDIILIVGAIVIICVIGALIWFNNHKSSGGGSIRKRAPPHGPSREVGGKLVEGVGNLEFKASARFAGARPGFVFKTGPRGLGYYADNGGDV